MAEEVRDDHQLRGGSAIDVVVAGEDDRHRSNEDSAWEIEEVAGPSSPPPPAAEPLASDADDVYVAVGKGGSSMAALTWALRQLAKPRSFVYLVHVFPTVPTIPTPCKQAHTPLRLLLRLHLQHISFFQMLEPHDQTSPVSA
ncbi:hypothetical protein ACQ4PT_018855 [Festuca glaucescens]